VGSEMCIRDSDSGAFVEAVFLFFHVVYNIGLGADIFSRKYGKGV